METKNDLLLVKDIFKELRHLLTDYMSERNFQMSNAQIFTFLTYIPNTLAIASDRQVDELELNALVNIAHSINVDSLVNLELLEVLSVAPEPENIMTNQEFNIRAGGELLHVSQNMDNYEEMYINAVKKILKFDRNPAAEGSLSKSFVTMMDNMVKMNRSKNKAQEAEKLKAIKSKLNLA